MNKNFRKLKTSLWKSFDGMCKTKDTITLYVVKKKRTKVVKSIEFFAKKLVF